MVESTATADYCRIRIRDLFLRHSTDCRSLAVPAGGHIYDSGMPNATLYFIECGQVRLYISAGSGQDYLLATRTTGDFFGESCLFGGGVRQETAVATQETIVRAMSRRCFLSNARRDSRLEDVMRYLTLILAEALEKIAALSSGSKPGLTPHSTAGGCIPENKADRVYQQEEKETEA
jgi:CRP/FNR family cyclic AMP-dependent transcriptional regulator